MRGAKTIKTKNKMKQILKETRVGWTSYLVGWNINEYFRAVEKTANYLKEIPELKNANLKLWCRGSSGAMISALLAQHLSTYSCVYINHLKKEGETSHNYRPLEPDKNDINLIVDDFVCSGETVNIIAEKIISNYKIQLHIEEDEINIGLVLIGDVKMEKLEFTPSLVLANCITKSIDITKLIDL